MSLMRRLRRWHEARPLLVSWAILAAGMLAMLVLFSRDSGLTPAQLGAMAAATVVLAWLCAWVIHLEERETSPESEGAKDL